MNFKSANDVQGTLIAGRDVERIRSANRVIVNNLFNGERPMDDAAATQIGLHVNANFGEGPVLAQQARRQFMNAFERSTRYFNVSIPAAPSEKKFEWEQFVNQYINRCMKNSRQWLNLGDYWRASVVAHGIGPRMWNNKEDWLPEYVALDDLRVPTNTLTDLSNLTWFARRCWYTEGELASKAFGRYSTPYWNKDEVAKLLDSIHDYNYESTDYRWVNSPEKMAEMVRQNGGWYSSDAVPSIPMWHFYYRDEDENGKERWLLRIVVDQDLGSVGDPNVFIYDCGTKSHAEGVEQLLSIQFGDMNNTAPFLYHSVRALGFLLVEPCFWSNLARCRTLQHLMEAFNVWFRVSDPAGRARAQKVETFDRCILEEGVSIVPNTERHQVDPQLIEMAFAQLKQLQSEASASYTAQSDTGTQKEQTAYETAVKVSQVNAMMTGMLLTAMRQEKYCYMEICRRFCLPDSGNKDAQKFQRLAKEFGIDPVYLNVEMWDVEPEQPLGAGNPTMEMSIAQQLIGMRGMYSPEAQQKILHITTAAITGSPGMAQELAPVGVQPVASDGEKWAASIFGTLMQGVPVPNNPSVSALEQIDTIIGMLATAIHQCEQGGNVANRQQLTGFASVMQYAQQLVQEIATDPQQGPTAKEYSRNLGELANILRGFAQRLQEQEAAGQQDPEAQAKIQLMAQQGQVKNQLAVQKTQQQLVHKEANFKQQQQHKAEQHAMSQQIAAQQAALQEQVARLETAVEATKAKVDIAATQAKAEADIQSARKKAEASPKEAVAA